MPWLRPLQPRGLHRQPQGGAPLSSLPFVGYPPCATVLENGELSFVNASRYSSGLGRGDDSWGELGHAVTCTCASWLLFVPVSLGR
ncbi:hypothetical protein M011DRAFT_466969 [Sporormia fimetaria CBS 119925]|uniref:Uncharacterized protein n=1 Tax=Sporormia fimetaria CBS 119925 TaxID=1340428 RepID=A0A6A6VEF1_9PLEO|nr:hypothetical protein M011DRAFT_466969 [Sporormia fimetaria CBS 119925]